MASELKIRIIKDSKGNKLKLSSITIEAAESLKIFIDSLATLASFYDDSSEFKLSLTEGSIESNLLPPVDNRQFREDMKAIIDGKLNDIPKIKAFKTIQDKIKQNGLDYEVLWKVNDMTHDLTQVFKGKNFTYKRNTDGYDLETVFIKGRLFATGGKKVTNIHLEDKEEEFVVACSEEDVVSVNKFIYKSVYLSCIKASKPEKKPLYTLIDYYADHDEQKEIQQFYNSFLKQEGLERFDLLHNTIVDLLSNKKIESAKFVIKLFNNKYTERGAIRTILMALKPLISSKSLSSINPIYEELAARLRKASLNHKI